MAASKQQPKTSSRGHTTIQLGNGVGGGGGGRAAVAQRRLKPRAEKPRQEICAPLKWTCFLINFVIFLASVGCLALGLYLFVNDPRPVAELADFLLNPAVLLAVVGLLSGVVALFGLFGALRDNVFLLKMFALCVFLAYLLLVVCTCLLFLLFYLDATGIDPTKGAISAQSVLLYSIGRYNANKNVADFIDYLQEQMECCGSTSFRDWHLSEQFSCNATNPYPERCGVPFSCCRRSVVSGAGPAGANGGGQQKPLSPAIRSIKCWQNAQKKREQELDQDIYVAGCLQPLRSLFDAHALHIGMAVVSVIMPVCLGVCLSQCLARQIDYQHFLLKREQRRLERRERREHRYTRAGTGGGQAEQSKQHKKASISSQSELMERGELPPAPEMPRRPPPKAPPPPTPRNDAEAAAMAAAIKASKQEWAKEQLRRSAAQHTRAASFSPRRNLGVGGKEEAREKQLQQAKRKSMTLDMAEPVASSSSKNREKEARKRRPITAEAAKKVGGGGGRERSKQQQQQPRNCSQPPVAPAQPSAPPIFLTLQQHHFQ